MEIHEQAYRALSAITDEVANSDHNMSSHPHRSVNHPNSHVLPNKDHQSLEGVAAHYHMGNYVKDRGTGRKT